MSSSTDSDQGRKLKNQQAFCIWPLGGRNAESSLGKKEFTVREKSKAIADCRIFELSIYETKKNPETMSKRFLLIQVQKLQNHPFRL